MIFIPFARTKTPYQKSTVPIELTSLQKTGCRLSYVRGGEQLPTHMHLSQLCSLRDIDCIPAAEIPTQRCSASVTSAARLKTLCVVQGQRNSGVLERLNDLIGLNAHVQRRFRGKITQPHGGLQNSVISGDTPNRIPPIGIGLQYPLLDVRKQKSPVDRGF